MRRGEKWREEEGRGEKRREEERGGERRREEEGRGDSADDVRAQGGIILNGAHALSISGVKA